MPIRTLFYPISVERVITHFLWRERHKESMQQYRDTPLADRSHLNDKPLNERRKEILKEKFPGIFPQIISKKWFLIDVSEDMLKNLRVISGTATWNDASNGSLSLIQVAQNIELGIKTLNLDYVNGRFEEIDRCIIIDGDENMILDGNRTSVVALLRLMSGKKFMPMKACIGYNRK